MSDRPRFRLPRKKSKSRTITSLTMEDGRVVTDPAEINRLLRLNGFTVDPLTGRVDASRELLATTKPQ